MEKTVFVICQCIVELFILGKFYLKSENKIVYNSYIYFFAGTMSKTKKSMNE